MPNVAVIFAGGSGKRMKTSGMPKQFLELYGKPIIVYTLEQFQRHPLIDIIVVACIETHISYLKTLITKFNLSKVKMIVNGGVSGQESIYNALRATEDLVHEQKTIVLIHDGVRPLIDELTITNNIRTVEKFGSCITCVPAIETIVIDDEKTDNFYIPNRDHSYLARAPQSFYLTEIMNAHRRAIKEKLFKFTDSCSMMSYYGFKLKMTVGRPENIKITTPTDFFIFRAIIDAKENSKIFGLI